MDFLGHIESTTLFVFIYVYLCPTRFPYHIMYVSVNSNTMGFTSGAGTDDHSGPPEFIPSFQWGSCCSIFSFMCSVLRSLFVLLSFFFWSLCFLSFHLRILSIPLESSNSSNHQCLNFLFITNNSLLQIRFICLDILA